jgi:hypothetical protein
MSKTATYALIASNTLGSAQSSVTFSSIPGTYTDLVLIANGQSTLFGNTAIQFNSDTATNYSVTYLYGDGTSAASGRTTSQTGLRFGTYNGRSVSIYQIMDYSNSTTNKTVLSRDNSTGAVEMRVGLWRKTPEAITSVKVYNFDGNTFDTGTTFKLYGIQAGNA